MVYFKKKGVPKMGEEGKDCQLSTFYIDDRLYGIDVQCVQEITRAMSMTPVPLAPDYVHGLINLRGQLATAVGLRELFGTDTKKLESHMNVVCEVDGLLLALIIDRIGDVIEVSGSDFEYAPDTTPMAIRQYMDGVYKTSDDLLSVISIAKISEVMEKQAA